MKSLITKISLCICIFFSSMNNSYSTEMERGMMISQAILLSGLTLLLVDNPNLKINSLYAINEKGNTITGEIGLITTKDLFSTGLEHHTSLALYKGYQSNFTVWTNELIYSGLILNNLQLGGGVAIWGLMSSIVPVVSLNYNIASGLGGLFENITMGYSFGASEITTHVLKLGTSIQF